MFKKLRRRFLWDSALVLLLVIVLVTGGVYWITSGVIKQQTGVLMEMILENDGDLPERFEIDPSQRRFLALNGESLYETRFVSARTTESGTKLIAAHIAVLSKDNAIALAETALNRKGSRGQIRFSDNRIFHYAKETDEDGSTTVVVLDSTSRYEMQRLTMMFTGGLWFIVLVLYVFVMRRYSKKLIKPFVENDEKQKRFITNASHELKTPLAVISANTEMAEAMSGKTKWTDSTRRQIARLQTLIEDLVVLTRLDEMKDARLSDVDFSAIASETAESFRGVAESSGRRYSAEIADNIHVKSDRRSLQHVVSILIDNAVKYCDAQGEISVVLEPRSRGKRARFTVSNTYENGKNVDTSRFFERFYRQDESHNSETAGFGIGLSMAKETAERMKGKLKVGYSGDTISFTLEL